MTSCLFGDNCQTDTDEMRSFVKNMGFGLILLIALSAVLLLFDSGNKLRKGDNKIRIAIFQITSYPLLDNTVRGYIDGLISRGYIDDDNIKITRFNSEGDLTIANSIATAIINQEFDLVLTASTPALQTMANANRDGEVIHVFGAVTDPFSAGVGLDINDSTIHPAHLFGAGTFQPVEESFREAKEMYPGLSKVGAPWCLAEACSEACVKKARSVCEELGIELIEANVEQSNYVSEVSKSLVLRGAEALWVGGDNVVEIGIDLMIDAGREGNIPVFTNNPNHTKKGALFALGSNYYNVGVAVAQIAADILDGKDMSNFKIRNIAPHKLLINEAVLDNLKDPWNIPHSISVEADSIFYK